MLKEVFTYSLLYLKLSVPGYRRFLYILTILNKIHIHVKNVLLNSIQEKKSKISSKKCHLFLPGEINKNENRLLTEICHENTRTYLNIWTSLTIFQRYHLWYPRRLKCLFLAAILNLSGKRGRSKRDNLGFFLILKNECRLIPEVNVFMNIE